jgi:uncharacterized phage-like protein YoqJ
MCALLVAVTGHRPKDLWGYDAQAEGWSWLRSTLSGLLQELGATEAISGMALGVDQVFVRAARDVKVPVAAYVPFEGQDRIWPASSQREYRELMSQCHRQVVVSSVPCPAAFLERNEAMVRDSDVVIAVWTGKQDGGTADAVRRSLSAGRVLLHVDPVARTVTVVA